MAMRAKWAVALVAGAALGLSGCGVLRGGGDGPTTPTVGNRTPILAGANAIEVDPQLASLQILLPPQLPNADWGQPGGNAAKSMGHLTLPASVAVAWTAQIDGGDNRARLASAPVVAGGTLYAIDTQATVHAFNAGTGQKLWSTTVG
ncbi:MAG: PQQ-binding-like beta-propeller repeat protein, partial [Sphingopyxis sp.]|nr:PQQ-binding-like beta-propeller repeat protein [Sphingopyxis sp.]